jgi:hypothetical protein
MPLRQPTEKQYGDIRTKLDAEAPEHNQLSYYHFDLMCRKNTPRTVIARLFNMKASSTIEDWQRQREELEKQ